MTSTDILTARAAWKATPQEPNGAAFENATEREFGRLYAQALVAEAEAARIEAARPKPEVARSILLIPILDRDYSVRTRHVMQYYAADIVTLGDLADKTPAELLRVKNLGRAVLNDLIAVLAAHGLALREAQS